MTANRAAEARQPTPDVTAFRTAMGSFPTGVTVVTVACGDGTMHGMTVNSCFQIIPGERDIHPVTA